MTKIFTPTTTEKGKNCKHNWKKLRFKYSNGHLFGNMHLEFDYLYCPKCESTRGEEIYD